MQKYIMSLVIGLLAPITLLEPQQIRGEDKLFSGRHVRVAMYVPPDSNVPSGYEERLRAVAFRAERFLIQGVENWGWEIERNKLFSRTDDGEIEIALLREALPQSARGAKALPLIIKATEKHFEQELGSSFNEHDVLWVFYHCPDQEVRGFRGMGDHDGGRCINAYPAAGGKIRPDILLGDKEMRPMSLKGCVHELGHAFGLPHIGPKPGLKKGNTLMGPVNKAFEAKTRPQEFDPRVYLCEASAAMLAKHPMFQSQQPIEKVKNVELTVNQLRFDDLEKRGFVVRGGLVGNVNAHSAIVLDSPRGFGDYWTRSYRSEVDADGSFSLTVDEPFDAERGNLFLYFCLADGRNTGTGERSVLQNDVIHIRYRTIEGKREFMRLAQPELRRRRPPVKPPTAAKANPASPASDSPAAADKNRGAKRMKMFWSCLENPKEILPKGTVVVHPCVWSYDAQWKHTPPKDIEITLTAPTELHEAIAMLEAKALEYVKSFGASESRSYFLEGITREDGKIILRTGT